MCVCLEEELGQEILTLLVAMKLAIAGIYTNYTTSIVDAEGIEQEDGFLGGPQGKKLLLKVKHV